MATADASEIIRGEKAGASNRAHPQNTLQAKGFVALIQQSMFRKVLNGWVELPNNLHILTFEGFCKYHMEDNSLLLIIYLHIHSKDVYPLFSSLSSRDLRCLKGRHPRLMQVFPFCIYHKTVYYFVSFFYIAIFPFFIPPHPSP